MPSRPQSRPRPPEWPAHPLVKGLLGVAAIAVATLALAAAGYVIALVVSLIF